MAFYADHVFPRIMDRAMDTAHTREIRARVCGGLAGEVVEIGFGSGLNLPHLPPSVTRLHAVDPSSGGARLAAQRIAESPVPVRLAGLDGQELPFDDASMDAALSTWTLCSIPDAGRALREVRRVLRPGGRLHLVEHGRAPDEGVRRWQERLNPVQRRVACGCHLDRDIPVLLRDAGFDVGRLEQYYGAGQPRPFGALHEGVTAPV